MNKMETMVKGWLDENRKKLQAGNFTEADFSTARGTSDCAKTDGAVSLFKVDKHAFSDC